MTKFTLIGAGFAGAALIALAACGDAPEGNVETVDIDGPAPLEQATEAEEEAAGDGVTQELAVQRESGPYAPRDECADLDGAPEFRAALAAAVSARDGDAMVALVDQNVQLDFGGGTGPQELRDRLVHPQWQLWEELEAMLPLGCAVDSSGGMIIPWYFGQDIPGDDFYAMHLVTGEDVPLLAEPSDGAEVTKRISWDIVTLEEPVGDSTDFAYVSASDGTLGHISWDKLRGLIDYRMMAARDNRGWRIELFLSGD